MRSEEVISSDLKRIREARQRADELYEEVMEEANKELLKLHVKQGRISASSVGYMAPEQYPTIESTQVKAVVRAIAKILALRKAI